MQLIDYLTDEDLETIQDWIEINKECCVTDIKDVLQYWNKNNCTLFKLLGNQLRVKIPIEIKVDKSTLSRRIEELYIRPLFYLSNNVIKVEEMNHDFFVDLFENYILKFNWVDNGNAKWFLNAYTCEELEIKGKHSSKSNTVNTIGSLETLFSQVPLVEGEITYDYTVTFNDKKPLTLPKGMKSMRAIQKFLKYIEYPNMYLFEKFRNEVSDICTTTKIKSNLVLSIHPIDFLTLSDNNCGWRSCVSMSSKRSGGFHTGLTEMLNSNCTLVAYLESTHKKFTFNFHDIPNKSWRQLFVCHKDILCSSKSYPYRSEMLTKRILEVLRDMAKKNLNWTYTHGPQLYKDIHCYENQDLHEYTYTNGHKIIFYTRGYYNDMCADRGTDYWCVRNYVDKTKFISISGPATCFMCGKPLLAKGEVHDTNGWFHERFVDHYEDGFCRGCADYKCDHCRITRKDVPIYLLPHERDYTTRVCEACLKDWVFKRKVVTYINKEGQKVESVRKVFNRKDTCNHVDMYYPVIDGETNHAKEFKF